jgi:hypothetical protein
MDLLKRLIDLDEKVIEDGVNPELCLELENIIDCILQLDDFDKTRLDADNLYMCNQLGVTSYTTFAVTMEDAIVSLSEYLHPVPEDYLLF